MTFPTRAPLEIWGGIECTLNRVGNRYFDQFEFSGHYQRPDDLDAIAALGIRKLRYPVLWERVAPQHPDEYDWSFADERLQRLRDLEITPIAGLVHHGSGPRYTDLLDPQFPEKLAAYAHAVAERYPWLEYYTPVNEPLTTARFSALYGHWYPHQRDGLLFARALLNQCRGVLLAMREIRRVNPDAKLVQTEDMGRTWSTPALAYQAEFENERRWLSFDLLCGHVQGEQRMAQYLKWLGVQPGELEPFLDTPCPPDILGINYYLTSERFLDERLSRYPPEYSGGNGRHDYVDVEAVRVCPDGIAGAAVMLRDAWQRYGLPLAITEAHLGCTREEQVRWLWEIWNQAEEVRRAGADVRAVTSWSLLGAYNWNNLVTSEAGCYEPGAFDLRGGTRHPTILTNLIQQLATGNTPDHPALATAGWWRQPARLLHPPSSPHQKPQLKKYSHPRQTSAPILISGATGTLGQAFARVCETRHLPHHALHRQQMDIADPASVAAALDHWKPWAVINTAGYVRVDDAETDAARCFRENTEGAAILARECATRGIEFITFSSDLVFDGTESTPYLESDAPNPLNVYGLSKARAEQRVLEAHPAALVIRTSAFFGPWDEYNFATITLRVLQTGQPFIAADDAVIAPTYVPDLASVSLDLLLDGAHGVWHLSNEGEVTWADFARQVAQMSGEDSNLIEGRPTHAMNWPAPRPLYSVLSSERSLCLPALDDALERYFQERDAHLATV